MPFGTDRAGAIVQRAHRALLIAATLLLPACHSAPPKGVVLVIIDTLRRDHLGAYGYAPATSPHLDQLAAEGERYGSACAQAPWTLPAVATILTGELPHVHGAGRGADGIHPVRRQIVTLAERLRAAGFRTAAFVNVVFCDPSSGIARGFEVYDFNTSDASNVIRRDAAATTDAALAWLSEHARESFFVVVHYFDCHLSYDPPPPYDGMFEPDGERPLRRGFGSVRDLRAIRSGRLRLDPRKVQSLVARYDGEIRYVDEQFGRLREGLVRLRRWDDSLVIVVADHGEEFWDHGGFEHGHSHFTELLGVPLLVRRPDGPSGVVRTDRVRQLDVAPTILAFAGLPLPADLPGHDLALGGAGHAIAEGSLWAGDIVSVRSELGTLILDRGRGVAQLFAPDDVSEQHDLHGARPDIEEPLQAILAALPPSRRKDPAAWRPTADQLRQLRALGYVR